LNRKVHLFGAPREGRGERGEATGSGGERGNARGSAGEREPEKSLLTASRRRARVVEEMRRGSSEQIARQRLRPRCGLGVMSEIL
jgi:hypothetical protein